MPANPILISNKVLQEVQPATYNDPDTRGTVLYTNRYSGLALIPMPDEWRQAFNSDVGETGNNIIVQLQQKVQQVDGGPWYVDSINGTIYIHNRKFNEPAKAEYNYQAENGELLMASFETQYITRNVQENAAFNIDSLTKLWSGAVVGDEDVFGYGGMGMDDNSVDLWDAELANRVIADYKANRITLNLVNTIDQDIRRITSHGAFTNGQWSEIYAHERESTKLVRDVDVSKLTHQDRPSGAIDTPNKYWLYSKDFWGRRALANLDLRVNMNEYIMCIAGGDREEYDRLMAEIYQAQQNGTLEDLAKRKFKATYTFHSNRIDGGARVKALVHEAIKTPEVVVRDNTQRSTPSDPRMGASDSNPDVHSGWRDGYRPSFNDISYTVSGYDLIMMTGARKPGGKGGITRSMFNNHKKVTEKKLVAKCIVVGRPHLESSQIIILNNVGAMWSGPWYIKTCVHKLDHSSGYTTEMELVQNRGDLHPNSHYAEGGAYYSGKDYGTINNGSNGADTFTVEYKGKSIQLNKAEMYWWNGASGNEREDLVLKYMAGEEDVEVYRGNVGGLTHDNYITITTEKPTAEQRKNYGAKAHQYAKDNKYWGTWRNTKHDPKTRVTSPYKSKLRLNNSEQQVTIM